MSVTQGNVFVHSATECFTDHLPHGEGLIFYDYLRALRELGYRFEGYSARVDVKQPVEGVQIRSCQSHSPLKSFDRFRYGSTVNRHFDAAQRNGARYRFVWRGNPFMNLCPVVPRTNGLPLVVGPLYRSWPQRDDEAKAPRIPIRPGHVAAKLGGKGWKRTLQKADLVLSIKCPILILFHKRKKNMLFFYT